MSVRPSGLPRGLGLNTGNSDRYLNMMWAPFVWQDPPQALYAPVASRPLVFLGCDGQIWLCSDFGLQVGDQLRCGFSGEFLERGSAERGEQRSDVLIGIAGPLGEGVQSSYLC
jgi:hypothetical protein